MKNKIGIFGGTFNPVHKAHVSVAKEFINALTLDLLYIIPNNVSPKKEEAEVSGQDRFNMLKIAFDGIEKVTVSDIELKRSGKSYTRDTIAELLHTHPNDELYLLIGGDWVSGFTRWKDYEFILKNTNIVIAARGEPNFSAIETLEKTAGKPIFILNNENIEISSSEIRSNRAFNDLPKGVYEYIKAKGLYGI